MITDYYERNQTRRIVLPFLIYGLSLSRFFWTKSKFCFKISHDRRIYHMKKIVVLMLALMMVGSIVIACTKKQAASAAAGTDTNATMAVTNAGTNAAAPATNK
jgi:hypothetical protein